MRHLAADTDSAAAAEVVLCSGWWWGWWRQSFSFCYPLDKVTLPGRVSRRPARSAVQFARSIQHVVERVSWLHLALRPHIWFHFPTASCSPWILLALDSSHLPTAILSVRLIIFPHI